MSNAVVENSPPILNQRQIYILDLVDQIQKKYIEVGEAKEEFRVKNAEVAPFKKAVENAEEQLDELQQELINARSGNFQPTLFARQQVEDAREGHDSTPGSSDSTESPHGRTGAVLERVSQRDDKAGLVDLGKALKLSENQVEKLGAEGFHTVQDLEYALRTGSIDRVSGLRGRDKIIDKLAEYRMKNPVPEVTNDAGEKVYPDPVADGGRYVDQVEEIIIPIETNGVLARVHVVETRAGWRGSWTLICKEGLRRDGEINIASTPHDTRLECVYEQCVEMAECLRKRLPETGEAVACEVDGFVEDLSSSTVQDEA